MKNPRDGEFFHLEFAKFWIQSQVLKVELVREERRLECQGSRDGAQIP